MCRAARGTGHGHEEPRTHGLDDVKRLLLLALLPGGLWANTTLTVDLPGGATMDFLWIEAGAFRMGSPVSESGRSPNEGPQHQVTISRGFWLGRYEVTQGQWTAVMDSIPWIDSTYVVEEPDRPASYVSWDDVQELIRRLNKDAGQAIFRLPSEAEWEYACRAGSATAWGFGADEAGLDDHAWYRDNTWSAGLRYAQPVGLLAPNPWGLFDMHGNVWEWCLDGWQREYSDQPETDPLAPSSLDGHPLRGGSFSSVARQSRSAYRRLDAPDYRSGTFGARLLMEGPAPTAVAPGSWGQVKQHHQNPGNFREVE